MPKAQGKRPAKKSSKAKKVGIGVALAGAAAAAAGAYYFYGPDGKKHRKKARAWSVKAKREVKAGVKKIKKLDKVAYHRIVDQVTKKYKKAKDISSKDVDNLARELKKEWKVLEKSTKKLVAKKKPVIRRVAKKIKRKTTRKPAKKIAKKTTRKRKITKKSAPKRKAGGRKTKRSR